MTLNPIYMQRCIQLARKGEGFTNPNPMVGAVIVHNNRIIGEGYHRQHGTAHAEVNAIASVKDKSLLTASTMYVSLEPCAHHGHTPPCAELIISREIPRVVVAVTDPNPKVAGKGIEMMRKSGIDVSVGMLAGEAREQNRIFFVNHLCNRPYIILKWAQSMDGFMDLHRTSLEGKSPVRISNSITHSIVHKFRTQVQGIIVGTNTALLDNPQLTSRKWFGTHPTRIVIDRENRIPPGAALFDGTTPTIIFTASVPDSSWQYKQTKHIVIDFSKDTNTQILDSLYIEGIHSLLVEGGAKLLSSFIDTALWDEAFIERSGKRLLSGVKAPDIQGEITDTKKYLDSVQFYIKSKISRNIL
ncbi:MAG: bifunctional diaminohydroxyphosphoribosylaminopyrimidine deaminase/5-amino-6-(5-phosphoribosylamino)uracil reductase RibD [Proteiniphilum sp.]|nr:bifunctional diaminohydroxyphosphoribosylaminopyrimidine deaminase/5-amino-6-(5-phosphoribosylamino)uracil reductase RibD [Proteiniphilum sp.]